MKNIANLSGVPLVEETNHGLGSSLLVTDNPTNANNDREINYLDPNNMKLGTANNYLNIVDDIELHSNSSSISLETYQTLIKSKDNDSASLNSQIEVATNIELWSEHNINISADNIILNSENVKLNNICMNCVPTSSSDLPVSLIDIPSDWIFEIPSSGITQNYDGTFIDGGISKNIRFIFNKTHSDPWYSDQYAALGFKYSNMIPIIQSGTTAYQLYVIEDQYSPILISMGQTAAVGLAILKGTDSSSKQYDNYEIKGKDNYHLGIYVTGDYAYNVTASLSGFQTRVGEVNNNTYGELDKIKLIEGAVYIYQNGIKTIDELGFHLKTWGQIMS